MYYCNHCLSCSINKKCEYCSCTCKELTEAKTAQIVRDGRIFSDFIHYIEVPNLGKCELIAIHKEDESTKEQYIGYQDSTLISLKPLDGSKLVKRMIDNDSVWELKAV
ncbi:hypothetical protein [Alteromonas gracilis]|uniref:hypothetical protein n=1 Tax=Alteromonas gracilis TaxID=1479524 RepID=UPI003735BA19